MRERVIEIFRSLPPEGIGIHGTNLANARDIKIHGFSKTRMFEDMCYAHHYYVQPQVTEEKPDIIAILDNLKFDIDSAIFTYAKRATVSSSYAHTDNLEESKIPALVIFKPQKTAISPILYPSCSRQDSDDDNISSENILGFISIAITDNNSRLKTTKRALRDIHKLLKEKGVINFGELPLPQAR